MSKNNTILVTGSSGGIGKAIALRLAEQGYNLVLHCHKNRTRANLIADQISKIGRQVRLLQFDITDREKAKKVLEEDIEALGVYYGIVCNAGIAKDNAFPAIDGNDWDQVVTTNLDGFYNVLHPLIMPMIRSRSPGRIVTLSSVSGVIGNRGQVNYSAAKAGIIGATKALAVELAKRHITVNCVAPGLIDTDMTKDIHLEEALKTIPMNRVGNPNEVAGLVNFLMSEEAAYITRQVISINGGMY